VVFLAPGCAPCEAVAPDVGAFARSSPVEVLAVVLDGEPDARSRIAAHAGPAARLDLDDLVDRWHVPGTPFGVALDTRGRVVDARVALSAAALEALAAAALERRAPTAPAEAGGLSRRLVLRRAAGAAALVAVGGALPRTATALASAGDAVGAGARRLAAVPKTYVDRNTKNRFGGTCNDFGDRLLGTGVYDWDKQALPKALGYTWAEGLEDGQTPKGASCRRRERVTKIWRGSCSCPTYREYTDEAKCNVECPKGLACFGVQCQTLERRVCVDIAFDVCLEVPTIVLSVLEWKPPKTATKACKAYAAQLGATTLAHERHHAEDVKRALKSVNDEFKNRSVRGCGETEEEARREAEEKIKGVVDRAGEKLKDQVGRDASRYHNAPEGRYGILDCRICDP
jgi:hypothetical protein